jgi:hypothetical protein
MKTTEQELDEYLVSQEGRDKAALSAGREPEVAIRWLCRRLDESKAEVARLSDAVESAQREYNILAKSVDEMARARKARESGATS